MNITVSQLPADYTDENGDPMDGWWGLYIDGELHMTAPSKASAEQTADVVTERSRASL